MAALVARRVFESVSIEVRAIRVCPHKRQAVRVKPDLSMSAGERLDHIVQPRGIAKGNNAAI